jgi:hypothetical protein
VLQHLLSTLPRVLRVSETLECVSNSYGGTLLIRHSLPLGTYSSICLGPYGGPRGETASYERGTPVLDTLEGVSYTVSCPQGGNRQRTLRTGATRSSRLRWL